MQGGIIRKHLDLLQTKLSALLLFIVIITDSLARAQVNVEPNTAVLNEGAQQDLLCRYGRPITYCRIEIPGETKVFNLSPDWDKTPGFIYNGKGLQAGECGVRIEHVKAINNGQVKCNLGVEGEELSGTIDLVVALRPKQPLVELITKPDRDRYFHEGNKFQARCIVRDGRPVANITWLLDNEPAAKRVGQLEVLASPRENGLELFTAIQDIQWDIAAEDNGRRLVCRSHHQTDPDNAPPQEGAYELLVRYSPLRMPETLVYGLYLEHTVKVNMTIRANPTPVIEWAIDGNVIRQGEQSGRFSAFEPEYLGHDFYNVTLVIAGLTLEDTTKIYTMRATNALGSTDYTVRISSSATPPSAGLEIGAIVGIVVALAVLVLIVLLVLFARATGRWCFAGKTVKMSTNETSDTESADVRATSTATATTAAVSEVGTVPATPAHAHNDNTSSYNNFGRKFEAAKRLPHAFTALFKRLHERDSSSEKRKDTELMVNETDGVTAVTDRVQQQQTSGPNNGANANGNDNQSKEDKQLVYAELVLKPSENSEPLPPKSSTEYAEIVYVQKPKGEQQQIQQHQQQQNKK
ncbi:fasciclin-3 isoform X2 [Glossina fuscipes]|uniref:Fasciclin-3 isoform X2 n=1 Tax=Glossina fuscipes TaxID=7396 RepID=A0A8U0W995_9MUSC|nr:fasciclin-3 isoform X2 [Glossina fuscipes]